MNIGQMIEALNSPPLKDKLEAKHEAELSVGISKSDKWKISVPELIRAEQEITIETLRDELKEYQDGFKGSCYACEPVSDWWSLVMNAAASLEDVAAGSVDTDTKRIAMSAAEHFRKRANELYTKPQKVEAVEMSPRAKHEAEPVYAFRRKGLDDFCTCSEDRYLELSEKPLLFEVAILYTKPPSTKAAVAAAIRKAAEVALDSCLVPPDGGSPSAEEYEVAKAAHDAILALPHDDSHLRELMMEAVIEALYGIPPSLKPLMAKGIVDRYLQERL